MKQSFKNQSIFLLLLIASYGLSANVLNVPQIFQEQTQWCWAGTSQAIFRFYGVHLSQTEIAQVGSGGRNEWIYLYGRSGFRSSIQNIFSHWSVGSQAHARALSLAEAGQQIQINRPFIVRWGWNTGGGHFVVVRGLEVAVNQAYIMDPWYGKGYQVVNFNWLHNDGRHLWTHTLTTVR